MAKYRNSPAHGVGDLERKDDSGGKQGTGELDTKKALHDFMGAFEEFKTANDERLAAMENGQTDPIGEEKLTKINGFLDKYEDVSQKLTLAAKTADALKEHDERFDQLETMLKRKHQGDDTETKEGVDVALWTKAVVNTYGIGMHNMPDEQRKALEDTVDEYKALNVSTLTEGGHLAPLEYVREIIKAVTEISPVRSLARVRQTGSKGIEIPKRTGEIAAQWVAEQGTKSDTENLTYGMVEINTHELYALVDITNQMLEDSLFNMNSEIAEESAEQFALAEGRAFISGDGSGKPFGFLDAASGIDTVESGTADGIADADGGGNGLLTLKYSLKTAYARNATWLLNRTTMGQVRMLKDKNGDYLWRPGIALGQPNTIDGDPYVEMPDMPAVAAGTLPVAYGDFRRGYTWVDRIAMEMLRDPYTQATGGKVRYIMRKRVAGKVVLPEAIKALEVAVAP